MENFATVIEKKERAAWWYLDYVEEIYGTESVEREKALSEWAALNRVRMMLESQDVFDNAYETWMND
jgi:hypothetical protein